MHVNLLQLEARMREKYPALPEMVISDGEEDELFEDDPIPEVNNNYTRKRPQEETSITDIKSVITRSEALQAQVASHITGGTDPRSRERQQWGGVHSTITRWSLAKVG